MQRLSDAPIPVRFKLSALWAATMFCYVYCDYFELYVPGKLQGMLQGQMQPLGAVTQGILFVTALLMAIPSLLVFVSLVLAPALCRWLNIVFGVLYTLLMLIIALQTPWYFYKFFATTEAAMTALVVWYAWRWPRQDASN